MANAVQTQVSDGTLNIVNVGLEYFKQADIAVTVGVVDGPQASLTVGVDYQWTSDSTIQFLNTSHSPSGLVPAGETVTLTRSTEIDQMLNIYDGGAPFNRTTLDENFKQLLFIAQEFAGASGLDALADFKALLKSVLGAAEVGVDLSGATTVQEALEQAETALGVETAARIAADGVLNTAIADEVAARIAAVSAEVTARTNADTALNGLITTETANRIAADAAEVTARNSAINTAIAAEVVARDSAITTAMTTEIAARNAAILAATGAFTPETYGAVGNGTTNDRAAVQAALDAAGAANGGTVLFTKRYLIDTSINIPKNVRLLGTWNPYGTIPWKGTLGSVVHNYASTIIINTAATINLNDGASLANLSLLRKGMTVAEVATTNFAGTAITGLGGDGSGNGTTTYPTPGEMNGIVLKGLQILGFNQAIRIDMCPRALIKEVAGDCINGITIGTTYDVLRMKDCHFWPYSTMGANGSGAQLNRSGIAYNFTARNDIAQIDGCFSYGWFRGFRLGPNIGTCNFTNCAADGTAGNTLSGSIGYYIENNATFSTFIGCVAYSNDYGFWTATTAPSTDSLVFTNCRAVGNVTDGLHLLSGNSRWIGCIIALSQSGVVAAGANTSVDLNGCIFSGNTTNDIAGVSSPVIRIKDCKFDGTAAIGGFGTQNLASADPLLVPRTGDFFYVTGTTGFGTLGNGWAGRRITLQFAGALTMFNNPAVAVGAMHLNGNANFVTTANDTIELIHNGNFWSEVARSINP